MSKSAQSRFRVRFAEGSVDLNAVLQIRAMCFRGCNNADADRDRFDPLCKHFMVEDQKTSRIVCTYRVLSFGAGSEIDGSYAAQFYNLEKLRKFQKPMLELGRFCIAPDMADPDILRIAWGALARYVIENGVEMLFGCSSFTGVESEAYADSFAMLREKHLAPDCWRPGVKAPNVFKFSSLPKLGDMGQKAALNGIPPLLRTYLTMGGWVSDHAVLDHDLNTLHVFTGLEISAIPPARRRMLLAL